MSKILVAFDYDPPSRAALAEATRLATAAHARLVIAHVYGPEPIHPSDGVPLVLERSAVSQLLECDCSWARSFGIDCRVAVAEGDVADQLLRLIRDERPDLVVVGTHGRTGLDRLVLGSVAQRLLRTSPRPVLVVRPPRRGAHGDAGLRRIVVGVDFTPASTRALEDARWLAKLTGAHLVLLHAIARNTPIDVDPSRRPQARLDELAEELRAGGVGCTPIVTVGDAATALLAESEGAPTALIALGTRARAPSMRRLFGSVADAVLRRSRCPVLVAHAAEPAVGTAVEQPTWAGPS